MDRSREALLQPSLSDSGPHSAAPYSMQTVFLSAFVGGPLATLSIATVNSVRLRRLLRDLPVLLAMLVVTTVAFWWLLRTPSGATAQSWLHMHLGASYQRYYSRLIALVLVGVAYLLHRREERNALLVGLDRPNGWIGGLACIAAGFLLLIGLLAVIERL